MLSIFSGFLVAISFIGCVLPFFPGAFLSYLALLLQFFFNTENEISVAVVIIFGAIHLFAIVLDYLLPLFFGGFFRLSKQSIYGSYIGMVLGIVFFPPFGMAIGMLAGTVLGEMFAGKNEREAFRAGIISFLFSVGLVGVNLFLTATTAFFAFKGLFF